MLSAESEVLLRNQEYFDTGKWLVINAADAEIFSYFPSEVVGLHQLYSNYLLIENCSKGQHYYGALLPKSEQFDGIIIYWPKSKQQGVMLCHYASSMLSDSGHLLIVGDNKCGVKSAAKALKKIPLEMNKIDSARHCTLLGTLVDEDQERDKFDIQKYVSTYKLDFESLALTMNTLPGAFSSDALDPGSELLLSTLGDISSDIKSTKVLDFACGNGVIGLSIASRFTNAHVIMSDINALSLLCIEANIAQNKIDKKRIEILTSDGLDSIEGQFDVIVSNPPFHSGTKTDYSITERFLRDAKQHLCPKGKLRIVANRFLKYPDQLMRVFGNVEIIEQNSKFTVYQSIQS
ncbi:methyltransferase [Alteromonas sp. a30]|uniref:methyltransferase n=1 Tax=Alteromonas sp. a30 TaxID=2730917 RepID=UPI0022800CA4|nr:methyltransferase [Alteromonas sp. a30]MCY7297344.1 methyltransferase [Alteromonas sp. a30]